MSNEKFTGEAEQQMWRSEMTENVKINKKSSFQRREKNICKRPMGQIHVMRVLDREEEEKTTEKISEEKTIPNFHQILVKKKKKKKKMWHAEF